MAKLPRMSVSHAKDLAADWAAEREQSERQTAITTRFSKASATEVIRMWETGRNEKGHKLSNSEFAGLVERWCELFGTLPPDDDAPDESSGHAPVPRPQDDTMLRIGEVVRVTGLSASTIKRMVLDGRFPKPMRLSPRRIGWPAAEVKAWVRQLDDQRSATKQ
jgi:prophage regulatory protein